MKTEGVSLFKMTRTIALFNMNITTQWGAYSELWGYLDQ